MQKVRFQQKIVFFKKRKEIMKSQQIILDFPSDILLTLNENEKELKHEIKVSLAMRMFQLQKLTLGKAAQLCGLSRFEFETLLSENRIPISNLSFEDVLEDSKKLR
jgi:predicted HTH domain antitoxin